MAGAAVDRIVAHVGSLPDQPMHRTGGGRRLARWLKEDLPEQGTAFEPLLRMLFDRVIPRSLNTASPGYLAYVPGGGLFHTAVADLISAAVNRYVGVWVAAPGLVQIEENVIGWLRTLCGLPDSGGGLLTTGGSMANLIAVVTARRTRLPPDFLKGIIYVSDQVHHSVTKAALMAGFPEANVHVIASGTHFAMDVAALRGAIDNDLAAGRVPFMVVGSGGTTNTGAVDDLQALAALCEERGLWFHVDAAYGGAFMLTDRGRTVLRGLQRADSVTLDPHKGLFVSYGTGCVLLRDRALMRQAHHVGATYLPRMQDEADYPDYSEMGPELSRSWRGLRVWLPLKMHGAGVFRQQLDEKLDLAAHAAAGLARIPHVQVVAPPQLSLLAFRVVPAGVADADLDALNRRVLSQVNQAQRVLLTGTTTHGMFLLRICILSFRTHRDRVDMALQDVAAAVAACVDA